MSIRLRVLLLFFWGVAVWGCGLPQTHYYIVEVPHASAQTSPAIPRHLTVARFRAADVLQDDRILYRSSENEVGFYEYQRWASPPVDLVTQYLLHRLKDSGVFSGVHAAPEGIRSDYTLQGRVMHFEERDRGKEVSTHVALEAELTDNKTHTVLWRDEVECTRPVGTHTVSAVVQGIEQCLDETSSKLLMSLQSRGAKWE